MTGTEAGFGYAEMRDDGEPVPSGDRERIFDSCERGAHDHHPDHVMGMGLGLSVSRHLARAMGGDLTYDHDGAETVFRLTLPLQAEALALARETVA